jgi:hypothetical protein
MVCSEAAVLVGAALGRLRDDKLTRSGVRRMVDAIAQGKTAGTSKTKTRGKAVATGDAGIAACVVELLGGIWAWVEKRGPLSDPAPTTASKPAAPRRRTAC